MTDPTGLGPDPSPGRGRDDQPGQPDDTWPYERAQLLLTTSDVDLFAGILRPAVGLIATMRIVGHDRALDVHLDAITAGDGQRPPQVTYRRVDDALRPAGAAEIVSVAAIAHLHLW